MTWFDSLIILVSIGIVLYEARQEAGRGLLDAVMTMAAVHFSAELAPAVTLWMQWKPLPGSDSAPLAMLACFLVLWLGGLLISRTLHRQFRWSMDQFDFLFGAVFGMVIAVSLGHVITDMTARFALASTGELPHFVQNSLLADELRNFRSYHYVLAVFHNYQDGRGGQ